ncbi:Peroxidase 4 [Dendrobium catenatum]|uniref:Peroxidase n=1 Tax=Dendrobium catenatum TaxID=906689 RepID=A0A2I0XCH0_9ASPA|nr:Peroxidase 4 [Dendrobium catenatum]
MASSLRHSANIALFLLFSLASAAQLDPNFYSCSCPNLFSTIKPVVQSAISKEKRMGASLLRLFFHDCFVNGCDGSLLLDDTPNFTGEKNAVPNNQSVRGFDVIDKIKAAVEKACPGVVSCADILAITARDSVVILGGPNWNVKLGRRDARTASLSAANTNIPPPTSNLSAHTIGQARCTIFRARIYNDSNIDSSFDQLRKSNCPQSSGDANLAPLDLQTPTSFDNNYYKNLLSLKGLLHSDQQLFNKGSTDSQVRKYANKPNKFNSDFVAAIIKMGDISPLTGSKARCTIFRARIYNDSNIDSSFDRLRKNDCVQSSDDGNLAPLYLQTSTSFDNNYYKNLLSLKDLFHSDQQLFNKGSTDSQVRKYANKPNKFNSDFVAAIIKMGDISLLTVSKDEIRKNFRKIN